MCKHSDHDTFIAGEYERGRSFAEIARALQAMKVKTTPSEVRRFLHRRAEEAKARLYLSDRHRYYTIYGAQIPSKASNRGRRPLIHAAPLAAAFTSAVRIARRDVSGRPPAPIEEVQFLADLQAKAARAAEDDGLRRKAKANDKLTNNQSTE
jgi:hypothetical protein